ncbi:hypothetical protein V2A60_007258 [Cordyceps javanica]
MEAPKMDVKGYYQLSQSEQSNQDESSMNSSESSKYESIKRNIWKLCWCAALFCSVCLNALLLSQSSEYTSSKELTLSKYANLAQNVPTSRNYSSIYSSPDRSEADAAWKKLQLDIEAGWVALEDRHSESIGLPHSVRWPWDDSKGIYILSAAHELHCVYVLRTFINNVNDGEKDFRYSHGHAAHCIEALREVVMCAADDYPLYKGALNAAAGKENPRAGFGTVKMCRDWKKLVAWAKEHTACWQEAKTDDLEDKFKKCPDDSRPWERVVNHS